VMSMTCTLPPGAAIDAVETISAYDIGQ